MRFSTSIAAGLNGERGAGDMTLTGGGFGRLAILWLPAILTTCALAVSAQDDLPEGKGKETLENTCTECHGLDKALGQLRTGPQWRAIAVRMRLKGATMSDDELNTLVEYLSQNFGAVEEREPKSASATNRAAKVEVNKASAKEIETVLKLRPAEAQAIVRYREANGPFRAWPDLTKADGIEKSRIEAVKDRIKF